MIYMQILVLIKYSVYDMPAGIFFKCLVLSDQQSKTKINSVYCTITQQPKLRTEKLEPVTV